MLIVGANGFAKQLLDSFERDGIRDLCFFDDVNLDIDTLYNYPVVHNIAEATKYFKKNGVYFVLGIGVPYIRKKLCKKIESWGGQVQSFISKNAIIGNNDVSIHKGTTILDYVLIESGTNIGQGCLLNTSSAIHHDCSIGNYCEISPAARLLGGVTLGDYCAIGAGAIILPNIKIGDNVTIGAGAIVTKNVDNNLTVKGNPARL